MEESFTFQEIYAARKAKGQNSQIDAKKHKFTPCLFKHHCVEGPMLTSCYEKLEDTKGLIRRYQGGHHQKIPRGSSSEDTKGVIIRSNKWKDTIKWQNEKWQ